MSVSVEYMWVARCGQKMLAEFNGSEFVITSPCPAGHTGPVSGIIASKCGDDCPMIKNKTVAPPPAIPDTPTPPKEVPVPVSAAAPAPVAEEKPPVVAPHPQVAPVAPPVEAVAPPVVEAPTAPAELPQVVEVASEPVIETAPVAEAPVPEPVVVEAPVDAMPKPTLPPWLNGPTPTPVAEQPVQTQPATPVAAQAPAVPQPEPVQVPAAADPMILPYDFAKTEDEVPSIESILAEIPGYLGGPSEGGISSHQIGNAKCWRYFYWSHVRGLRPVRKKGRPGYVHYNDLGTLFHACMAMRYLYGADATWLPINAVEAHGLKDLAKQVRLLVSGMIDKYGEEEWHTWSVRGVEQNLITHLPKTKINGKLMSVPICMRVDLMVSLKGPQDPHPAPGFNPAGVYLLDHKTTRYMTLDTVLSYGMSWQLLVYQAGYVLGGHDKTYGPLNGIIVNLVERGRMPPDASSFHREQAPYHPASIQEFTSGELIPLATSIMEKLTGDNPQEQSNWAMDRRMCDSKYGRCPYFRLCDRQSIPTTGWYVEEPSAIIDVTAFAKPGKTPTSTATAVAAEKAEEKVPEVQGEPPKFTSAEVCDGVAAILNSAMNSNLPGYEYLVSKRDLYLGPGTSKTQVVKRFAEDAKLLYGQYAKDKVEHIFEIKGLPVIIRYTPTGFSWEHDNLKGRVSWKKVTEALADNHWYNLAELPDPIKGAQG